MENNIKDIVEKDSNEIYRLARNDFETFACLISTALYGRKKIHKYEKLLCRSLQYCANIFEEDLKISEQNPFKKIFRRLAKRIFKKLIVNIPPRHFKTFYCSIAFPCWLMARKKRIKVAIISSVQQLRLKCTRETRQILYSNAFKQIFPDIKIVANSETRIILSNGSLRFPGTPNVPPTGEGYDLIIFDDFLGQGDLNTADQERKIEMVHQMLTREDKKGSGVVVVVEQRLHINDLTAFLSEFWNSVGAPFYHIIIPLLATKDQEIRLDDFSFERKKGDLLNSERVNRDAIKEISPYIFETQYQQNPIPFSGKVFKQDCLIEMKIEDFPSSFENIYISADTSYGINDPSGIIICGYLRDRDSYFNGKYNNCLFLLDAIEEKLDLHMLSQKIITLALSYYQKYQVQTKVFIEKASSGFAVEETLKRTIKKLGLGIQIKISLIPPKSLGEKQDSNPKIARAMNAVEFMKDSFIIPNNKEYSVSLKKALFSFPNAKHDDLVDAISQLFNRIGEFSYYNTKRIEARFKNYENENYNLLLERAEGES